MSEAAKPRSLKGWGVSGGQLTMAQRWVSLVSMMITGLAVVFIVMKWNPVLAIVGAEHGMNMSSGMYIPFLVTDPQKMDYVLGIMAFVTNLTFFGNGLFGALIAQNGFFDAALFFLGIPLVICVLLLLFFVKSDRRIVKEEQASA